MDAIIEYIKNHIPLTIVLAVIFVAIIVLVVFLAIEISRKKRKSPAEAPVFAESAPAENTPTVVPAAETEVPAVEAPQEEPAQKDEMAGFIFVPVKKEKKTVAEAADNVQEETMKQEKKTKPAPVAAKKPAAKPAKKESIGKWVVYEEDRGGYGFKLVASNGEEMLKSSSPYASLSSAKSGIKTYQDNIAAGRLEVVETKKGNFFVQVNNASKRLLATSADYKTRVSCENALESIKRWAATTVIAVEGADDEKK